MPQDIPACSVTPLTLMPISDKALSVARLIRLISRRVGRPFFVASVESCTGGQLSAALTGVPGASEWFHTGLVTYTPESKELILGVPSEIIQRGLVTEETAISMAEKGADRTGADYVISTTGVMGPASSEGFDPLTVWIAVKTPLTTTARLIKREDRGRSDNQAYAVVEAIKLLEEALFRDYTHLEGREHRSFFA